MASICSSFAFDNKDFSDRVIQFVEVLPIAVSMATPKRKRSLSSCSKPVKAPRTSATPSPSPSPSSPFSSPSPTARHSSANKGTSSGGDLSPLCGEAKLPENCLSSQAKKTKLALLAKGQSTVAVSEDCHVSRALLASRSAFFKSLFSQGFAEKSQNTICIQVNQGEALLCIEIIKFIYDGCQQYFPQHLTIDQLMGILVLSDRFDIPLAVSAVVQSIRNLPLTHRDCEMLLTIPDSILSSPALRPLVAKVDDTLQSHFGRFDSTFYTTNFLTLSAEAVVSIISHKNLKIQSENTIWQALEIWARMPTSKPRGFQKIFIPHLRFPTMDIIFLLNVVRNSPICAQFPEIERLVNEAVDYHALQKHPSRQKVIAEKGGKMYCRRSLPNGGFKDCSLKLSIDKQKVLNAVPGRPNGKINDILIGYKRLFANGYTFLGAVYRMISANGTDMLVLYIRCEDVHNLSKFYLPLQARFFVGRLQALQRFAIHSDCSVHLVSLVNWASLDDSYFVGGKFGVTVNLFFDDAAA